MKQKTAATQQHYICGAHAARTVHMHLHLPADVELLSA
jgi:hypothetical protein